MTLELGTLCMEGGTLEKMAIFADFCSRLLKYFVGNLFRVARLPQSYGKCQIDRCYQRGVSIFREVDNFKLVDDFEEVNVSKEIA